MARRLERLERLAGELAGAPGRVVPFRADVTVDAEARAMVDAAVHAFGGIEALVNNRRGRPRRHLGPAQAALSSTAAAGAAKMRSNAGGDDAWLLTRPPGPRRATGEPDPHGIALRAGGQAMDDQDRRRMIERYFEILLSGDFEAAGEVLHDDFMQEWPQSGERVRGKEACAAIIRNYPGGGPTGTLRRVVGGGDVWVMEADLHYPTGPTHGVFVLEFQGDKVARATDWFADPFPAPEWRMEWVERM